MAGQSCSFVTKQLHTNSQSLVFPWRPLPSSNAIAIAVHTHDSTTKQPHQHCEMNVSSQQRSEALCVRTWVFIQAIRRRTANHDTSHQSPTGTCSIFHATHATHSSKQGGKLGRRMALTVLARASSHLPIDTSQPHTTLKRRGQLPPIAITPLPQHKNHDFTPCPLS